MAWWVWLLAGLGLLGFELLTPGGFFILFFGLGALVVGALAGLGLTEPVWLQWLLFSLLSVGSLLLFRRRLLAWLQSPEARAAVGLVGDVAVLLDDVPPGAVGEAGVRGTAWSDRHNGPETLGRRRRRLGERGDGRTL